MEMDLLEYQAKALFRAVGIPVLPSQCIEDSREIKQLQVPYPVVLKSQVRAGGRGKVGGVRFVENTIDAIAASHTILNLSIAGEYPQVILAEARYNAQQELFLAVLLDYQRSYPVLLGSAQGGADVEGSPEQLKEVLLDDGFSPFYARRLALAMGLQGPVLQTVSAIVEKMYQLFETNDLNSIEINPLGINAQGEVMALDGKVTIDDHALGRHPELATLLRVEQYNFGERRIRMEEPSYSLFEGRKLPWQDPQGSIGLICSSTALAQATWDLLTDHQLKPAGGWTLTTVPGYLPPMEELQNQLQQILDGFADQPNLQAIFIHLLVSQPLGEQIAQALTNYLQPQSLPLSLTLEERLERPTAAASRRLRQKNAQTPVALATSSSGPPKLDLPLIIRLAGSVPKTVNKCLEPLPLYWTNDLEAAIEQIVLGVRSMISNE